jgi:hypothetical protein
LISHYQRVIPTSNGQLARGPLLPRNVMDAVIQYGAMIGADRLKV